MYAFFFDYRKGMLNKYSGIFSTSDSEDEEETETDVYEAWFGFFYQMAKGSPTELAKILELNFIYLLNFTSYETKNKKLKEFYDYGRYNILDWSKAKQ